MDHYHHEALNKSRFAVATRSPREIQFALQPFLRIQRASTMPLSHRVVSPMAIGCLVTSKSEEPTHPLPDGIAGAPRSNVRWDIPSNIAKPEVARRQRRQSYPMSVAAGGRHIRSELDELTTSFVHDGIRRDWSEMMQSPRLICFGSDQAVPSHVPGG